MAERKNRESYLPRYTPSERFLGDLYYSFLRRYLFLAGCPSTLRRGPNIPSKAMLRREGYNRSPPFHELRRCAADPIFLLCHAAARRPQSLNTVLLQDSLKAPQ